MGFQDLVSIAPWTIIAMLCNLLLQAYLFKRFLFKPVQNIMEKRRQEVEKIYQDAEQSRTEAETAKTAYESSLAQAREDAAEIVTDARRSAQTQAERIVSEAKAEAEHLREQANADIVRERRRVMGEMKDDLSGLAVEIAEKVTEKEIDAQKHADLIADFIDSLGDAS